MINNCKIPYPQFAFGAGVALKLLAGLGLLYAAYALIFFTAVATFLFYPFWKKTVAERDLCFLNFSAYLAVISGLFTLIS